jgi:hypothetical protein
VAQGVGPEFKPQNHKKKKKISPAISDSLEHFPLKIRANHGGAEVKL